MANSCDANGKCSCKANIVNDKCDTCASGFTNFPACESDGIYFGKLSYSFLNYLQKVLNLTMSIPKLNDRKSLVQLVATYIYKCCFSHFSTTNQQL